MSNDLMKDVARYDRGNVSKAEVTDEGYLKADAIVTRAGVFVYQNPDGTIRRELRHPDDVFEEASLASLKMRPITNGHPVERLVNADNAKRLAIGYTGENVDVDNPYIATSILITDKDGVDHVMQQLRRELSLGYRVDLIDEEGTYNGEAYTHRQTNIRYNHLAIVDKGRAGPEARIHMDRNDAEEVEQIDQHNNNDSITNNKEHCNMSEDKISVITLDGIEYKAPAEVNNAFTKAKKEMVGLKVSLDEQTAEFEKIKAEKDALKEKLDELSAVDTDAEIAKAVKKRVALIENLKALLGNQASEINVDSLNDIEVMKEVVKIKCPKANTDEASDVYVQARFDTLVEALTTENSEAIAKQREAIAPRMDSASAEVSSEDARATMLNRMKNAWKQSSNVSK